MNYIGAISAYAIIIFNEHFVIILSLDLGELNASSILTFFNFLSCEIRTAFRRTCYHICKTDAQAQEFVIVVRCQWLGCETTQM